MIIVKSFILSFEKSRFGSYNKFSNYTLKTEFISLTNQKLKYLCDLIQHISEQLTLNVLNR